MKKSKTSLPDSHSSSVLNEEQRKVREQMFRYILDAEEIYVGARIGSEYHIGYDAENNESLETLRNLEE